MHGLMRAVAMGAVLLTGACGWFDEDEAPLEGQRIPVREYRSVVSPPPPAPAPETDPQTVE